MKGGHFAGKAENPEFLQSGSKSIGGCRNLWYNKKKPLNRRRKPLQQPETKKRTPE
jgi:hypothetical protein